MEQVTQHLFISDIHITAHHWPFLGLKLGPIPIPQNYVSTILMEILLRILLITCKICIIADVTKM